MSFGLRRSGLAALVLAAVGLCVQASLAQESSTSAEVRDHAKFFSDSAIQKAEARLAALNAKHNVRTVIETSAEVPPAKADDVRRMSNTARQKFFSDWTRQKAILASEPDIYVLINREPSHLRVRTSPALRNRGYSDADGRALTSALLSGFRAKQYDGALDKAVETLEAQVANLRSGSSRTTTAWPTHTERPSDEGVSSWFSGSGLFAIVAIVGLGLLVMFVLSAIFRSMSGGYGGAGGGWGGGGGFFGSLLGTIGGVMAGSWLYDQFFGGNSAQASDTTSHDAGATADDHTEAGDYGGDFGGDDFGGGDFDGGGDFGGGDF